MGLEIRNGSTALQAAMVTTSWVRDDFANGRRRYKVFAVHVPVMGAIRDAVNPRMGGPPTVIGEITVEVPNLEVAKILHAAMGEMLAKHPVEILQVKA